MAITGLVSAIMVAGVAVAGFSTNTAWAGGPVGPVDNPDHVSEAVGTGTFGDALVGFHATGVTNEEASANVVAKCQLAGGQNCTTDAVTNQDHCIVAISDQDVNVVSGGFGVTIEAARLDALQRAVANGMPLPPTAHIVISDCHCD